MAADLDLVHRLAAADRGLAVLATTRADGSVHASLVNAGLLPSPVDGRPCLGVVVRRDARKIPLLRRAGRASLTFRSGWEWVSVEGPVQLVEPHRSDVVNAGDLPALLRAIFQAAGGTHDDWEEFDRVMAQERRVAVLVQPQRIIANA